MNNMLKWIRQKRQDRKFSKRLAQISSAFGTMEKLVKAGMLSWNLRKRQLFISEPLATVMLSKGAEGWKNFLNNVYQYVSYMHFTELWEKQLINRQGKAIAKAKRERPNMSSDEIQRIKRSAIAEMSETEVAIPKIEPIEFYVISDSTVSNPETTLCGTYNPDTDHLDIVMWEEIQAAISAYHKG